MGRDAADPEPELPDGILMSSVTWRYQAGDTSEFAFMLLLARDA
jgi:hypothetical protein